ncbi:cilia-and flagella-associated protein 20 [Favolaschia claudopus]|uniref:Cilia-and flagella-associated protein 20 n=1 Tax=Favolaschia claudopus TaxID=2862362 RepID=A0AAW0D2A8_9AGAR
MFMNTVQPEIVSIFSSTGSNPLGLFGTSCDSALPSDSFIHLLIDKTSLPVPPAPAVPISPPIGEDSDASEESGSSGLGLSQRVLHIQSPTLRTTYIRCPPYDVMHSEHASFPLGLTHPWVHIQVRDLGREWSFEIGLVDRSGHVGIVRLSTFQKEPRLNLSTKPSSPPILHLPLSFPPISSRPLTAWATVTLHLPTYLPHFGSSSLLPRGTQGPLTPASLPTSMPTAFFSHTSYVKVYATCRLRRIWFSQGGPSKKAPWEFELYGDEYR